MGSSHEPGFTPSSPGTPAPPPARPFDSRRSSRLSQVAVFVGVAVAVVFAGAIAVLFARVGHLEATIAESEARSAEAPVSFVAPPMTPAPPIELRPLDGEAAERSIVAAWMTAFSPEATSEQRATAFTDAGDLPSRIEAFGATRCGGGWPVVTAIRFHGDDLATVTFRFDGVGADMPFDGTAVRSPKGWLIDPAAISVVLDLAAGYCGVTTTTMG